MGRKRKRFDITKLSGVISFVARSIITPIFRGSHFRIEGYHDEVIKILKQDKPVIFALWHNSIIGSMGYFLSLVYQGYKLAPIASQSKDGEVISRIMTDLAPSINVVRGSSRKGGLQAFELLLIALENGYSPCITVDGPIGPKHDAKPGAIRLATLTGAPIVPLEIAFAREFYLRRSWDNSRIPMPFNRGVYLIGKPIYLKNEIPNLYMDFATSFINTRLMELTERAMKYAKYRKQIF